MVDHRTVRKHPHRLHRVDVIVRGPRTEIRVDDTLGDELKLFRDDELHAANGDFEPTLVREPSDVDEHLLKRRLVEVRGGAEDVALVAGEGRVRSRAERGAVADGRSASEEGVVEDGRSLDLLGLGHRASKSTGVPSRETVVEVVLDCFLGDRESEGNRLVGVASRVGLLRVVERDRLTFVLDRSCPEAAEHNFFLECTVRRLLLEDFRMLVVVAVILQTKQRVKAGFQLFRKLCARNGHFSDPFLRRPSNPQWSANQNGEWLH